MGRTRKRRENLSHDRIPKLAHDPSGPRTQVVWDEQVTALGLRLNANGRHTWVMNGRKTIGHWPDMRPEDARREVVGIITGPTTPSGITWREGLLHYMENHRTPKKRVLVKDSPATRERVEQLEKRAPFIDKPMSATTPDEIAAFLRTYQDRPGMHNAHRATMAALWSHCVHAQKVTTFCPVLVKPMRTNPHRDYFTEDELSELWGVLKAHHLAPWVLSFAELTYTWALRGREALSLRWDWIRGGNLEIPERKTQGRTPFRMWPEARTALERLPRMKGCPLVFAPPRGGRTYRTLADAFTTAVAKHWPNRHLTPHTLRRSRATHMRDAGYTDDEIIVLTGHSTTAQLRAYLGQAPTHVMDSLSPSAMRERAAKRR